MIVKPEIPMIGIRTELSTILGTVYARSDMKWDDMPRNVAKVAVPFMSDLRAKVEDALKAVDIQVAFVSTLAERMYEEIWYQMEWMTYQNEYMEEVEQKWNSMRLLCSCGGCGCGGCGFLWQDAEGQLTTAQ
jgi:hypothetical protein